MIILDGLDGSGKSECARLLSEITGFKYMKIKKGSLLSYDDLKEQSEIVPQIIEEINEGIEGESEIILDRGYLSAIITGKIFDPLLEINSLLTQVPKNLRNPGLGVIIQVPFRVAISRVRTPLTPQDEIVLNSNYDNHRKLLINKGRQAGYQIFDNSLSATPKELKRSLERFLVKHSY